MNRREALVPTERGGYNGEAASHKRKSDTASIKRRTGAYYRARYDRHAVWQKDGNLVAEGLRRRGAVYLVISPVLMKQAPKVIGVGGILWIGLLAGAIGVAAFRSGGITNTRTRRPFDMRISEGDVAPVPAMIVVGIYVGSCTVIIIAFSVTAIWLVVCVRQQHIDAVRVATDAWVARGHFSDIEVADILSLKGLPTRRG